MNIPAIGDDFDVVAVTVSRRLSSAEVQQVAGCLGYALARMNGEALGDPKSVVKHGECTTLSFFFDSTKCHRNSYSFEEAFADAAQYICEGTPVRRTNRAGAGTAGTRLVEGIGACVVTFEVDVDPEPTPPAAAALTGEVDALAELNAARDALNAAQEAYVAAAVRYAGAGL